MDKLLVCDLDGTLLLTENHWIPTLEKLFQWVKSEYGISPAIQNSREPLQYLGIPSLEIFRKLFPGTDEHLLKEITLKEDHFFSEALREVTPKLYEGVEETLSHFKESGWKIYLSSNCGIFYKAQIVNRTSLRSMLDDEICAGQYIPGKSKGEFTRFLIRENIRKRKLKREYSGFFAGDGASDMAAGRLNQLQTVWASYGYANKPEESMIDLTIERFSDLQQLI